MPTNQKQERKNPTFSKAFIIEKPQIHTKLEQYNKSQCTHHPALTINSGTILFQLYPTLPLYYFETNPTHNISSTNISVCTELTF